MSVENLGQSSEEDFVQESFIINDKGKLEKGLPEIPKPEEPKRHKTVDEVLQENIQEGSSEVRTSYIELANRSLFSPLEFEDGNIFKVSKRSKGEDTKVQVCRKDGRTGFSYYLKNDILVVPVKEGKKMPGSTGTSFLCCFALNLDDGSETALVYKNKWQDFLTENSPYVFVNISGNNVKSFSEKSLKRLSPEVKEGFEKVKDNWGQSNTKMFGYED
jgi:hypothetical protein